MSASPFCPHFQTRMEEIVLKSGSTLLPIRRCLLAERMVGFLQDKPYAKALIQAVVLDPTELPINCINGPDLDAVEHGKCTSERCAMYCSPSYRQILSRFHITDPQEIGCEMSTPAPDLC